MTASTSEPGDLIGFICDIACNMNEWVYFKNKASNASYAGIFHPGTCMTRKSLEVKDKTWSYNMFYVYPENKFDM